MLHIKLKMNDACSNMVANILIVDTPSTTGFGSNPHNTSFLKVVMVFIKLKHIFFPYTHPSAPGVGSNGQKTFYSESSHVAYQIKRNGANSAMLAHIVSFHTTSDP